MKKSVHGDDGTESQRSSNLTVLQLPANLLETRGIQVAQDIQAYLSNSSKETLMTTAIMKGSHSPLDIHITRPLTCYPDRGTGTGHPFRLVDYEIDTMLHGGEAVKEWTHRLDKGGSPPPIYQTALQTAMGYFDAEHILEQQQSADGGELSPDDRDTLDGCRLLQGLITDMDNELRSVRSFAAYEDNLFTKVIPFIHDKFEGLDDESAGVLQAFFAAHGAAVRRTVAHTTRSLLRDGGNGVPPYEISDTSTLQHFSIQWLLRQNLLLCNDVGSSDKSISNIDNSASRMKVMVGCSNALHVLDAVQAERDLSTQEAPLV